MSLLLIPILAQALMVNLGDRSELRLRGDQTGSVAFDVVNRGQLGIGVSSTRTNWSLSYTPSISLFDIASDYPALLIDQGGSLLAGFNLTRHISLTLSQSGSYGQRSLQVLALEAVGRNDASAPTTEPASGAGQTQTTSAQNGQVQNLLVPRAQTIRLGSTSSTIDIRCELDRHWQILARVGYSMSGGLNASSRESMPEMQTVSMRSALSYAMHRRDQLSLSIETSRSATETMDVRRYANIGLAGLLWEHQASRNTSFNALAGVSLSQVQTYVITDRPPVLFRTETDFVYGKSETGDRGRVDSVHPNLSTEVRTTQPLQSGRVLATFSAQLLPVLERMTGDVVTRAITGMDGRWSRRHVTLTVSASATNTVSGNRAGTFRAAYSLGQSLSYLVTRRWELEFGARQLWLTLSNGEYWVTWTGFAAATYSTGDIPW
ncbi:MAG: hypothetical protein ACM3ZE_20030 [Myxococcales bacterium]